MKVCISIDMDNYADYQSLVDPGGDDSGVSFYSDAVPRYLDALDEVGARATFFMVGRDGKREDNRAAVRSIAERGHEIGNHSYTHPYNFRHLPRPRKEAEIQQGDDAIADIIGERPVGFRTPSGDLDLETLSILWERDYLYESSVIPSPLLMWAFKLYGRVFVRRAEYNLGDFWTPFAPPWPYLPSARKLHRPAGPDEQRPAHVIEIPLSALPFLRVPFYATFLRMFPHRAFDWAVRAYGRKRPVLHMFFHLIDLFDLEGTSLGRSLRRAPGLGVPVERRRAFVAHAFARMTAQGKAITLSALARDYLESGGLAPGRDRPGV
jgi:hypothetical protein